VLYEFFFKLRFQFCSSLFRFLLFFAKTIKEVVTVSLDATMSIVMGTGDVLDPAVSSTTGSGDVVDPAVSSTTGTGDVLDPAVSSTTGSGDVVDVGKDLSFE
jgi:hypothetical protein